MPDDDAIKREVLELLQIHFDAYNRIKPYADRYEHPHPTDTRGWSQILVSALTGIPGYGRKKGPDLNDGSDVKAANCWDAIDTPRFNGCIKAGTQAECANSLSSLDGMPFLFFVMWDTAEHTGHMRCRVWVVNTRSDPKFREMARHWYEKRESGEIQSNNFQLHPPRNRDNNIFRNTCGNLVYPLIFSACLIDGRYVIDHYCSEELEAVRCTEIGG